MEVKLKDVGGWWVLWCPGCEEKHYWPKDGRWTFNGNYESPTFNPSLKIEWGRGRLCHFVLRDGLLQFQGDCTHALKSQQVPLPELPEGVE